MKDIFSLSPLSRICTPRRREEWNGGVSRAIASIAAELTFPIIAATADCDVCDDSLFAPSGASE